MSGRTGSNLREWRPEVEAASDPASQLAIAYNLLPAGSDGREAIFEQLYPALLGIATSMARTRHVPGKEEEDLVQDGLAAIVKGLESYDARKGTVKVWAAIVVERRVIDLIRQANAACRAEGGRVHGGAEYRLDDRLMPDEAAGEGEAMRRLCRALASVLDARELEIVRRLSNGETYKRIGRAMGCSPKRISRDHAAIRAKVEGAGAAPGRLA